MHNKSPVVIVLQSKVPTLLLQVEIIYCVVGLSILCLLYVAEPTYYRVNTCICSLGVAATGGSELLAARDTIINMFHFSDIIHLWISV